MLPPPVKHWFWDRPRVRRWGYRLHLIRYCVHCDGSYNEAVERGVGFMADRWVWHEQHEREVPQGRLMRTRDRIERERAER